ncbi:hypothetical protein [Micromonospora sp. IBHARD004]|uniref:hypothetical protein n=1 Tax=Micromonospora sp. IBHARD004 TaxID=3457764 RepID=UPI0040597C28
MAGCISPSHPSRPWWWQRLDRGQPLFRCDVFEVSAVETGGDHPSDWPTQHAGTWTAPEVPFATLAGDAAWARGDRQVRCFIWSYDQMKRSVKGGGPTALPVH